MNIIKLFTKNVLATSSLNMVDKLLSLLTLSLVSRMLGVEGFGTFFYLVTILLMLKTVANFGTTPLLVTFFAKESLSQKVFPKLYALKTALWAISMTVPLLYFVWSGEAKPSLAYYLTGVIGVLFLVLSEVPMALAQARLELFSVALADVIERIAFLLFAAVAYFTGQGMTGIVVALTMSYGARYAYWVIRLRKLGVDSQSIGTVELRAFDILRDASPILLIGIANILASRSNVLLLQHFLGEKDVGLYAAALKLYELFTLLPAYFVATLFPLLCKLTEDEVRFREYVKNSFRILIVLVIPIIGGIEFFSSFAITVIFGHSFEGASSAAGWIALGLVFSFVQLINEYVLIARGMQKQAMAYMALSACTNLMLNLILIPSYGMTGAALAQVLAGASYFIFQMTGRQTLQWTQLFALLLWLPAASGIAWYFFAEFSMPGPVSAYVVFLLGYVFSLLLSKYVKLTEMRHIVGSLRAAS